MPERSKIHPGLEQRLQQRPPASDESLSIIVKYNAGANIHWKSVHGIGSPKFIYHLIPAAGLTATPSGLKNLVKLHEVQLVWSDEPVQAMADESIDMIGAPQVWDRDIRGHGVKVAIVDTGIDPRHPDLANRIAQMKDWTGEGPSDNNGHGTLVAGIIGGSGAASGGRYCGVAPECTFLVAKTLRGDGTGMASGVMAGIEWAVDQGAQVVNLSLGSQGLGDATDALSAMAQAAVSHGVVVCAAAGNLGPGQATICSPGLAAAVLTVAATDKEDQPASFSSRGMSGEPGSKPDICFPGVNITSCRAIGTSMGSPVDDHYTRASGTSLAAAHASGACALLWQANPESSPEQIREALMASATDLRLDVSAQGKGRGDVSRAYLSTRGDNAEQQNDTPPAAPATIGWVQALKSLITGR